MREGLIKFIIHQTENPDAKDKEVLKKVDKNGRVNCYCSCTGNTKETATQFIYDEKLENIRCPKCKRTADEVTQTLKQYHERIDKRTKKPLRMVEVNYDWETGIHYYALNQRIDYNEWKKVKDCFQYYHMYDWEDCEPTGQMVGWMTRNPEKVEEILGIEETIEKQKKEKELKDKERKLKKEMELQQKQAIRKAFNNGEYMEKEILWNLLKDSKGVYEDPTWGWDSNSLYGGGRLWIITDTEIYQVTNNGNDGDDWSRNNIDTGGGGAIGYRIEYNDTIADNIRSYGNEYG